MKKITNARYRPPVDQGCELAVLLIVARHHSRLQGCNDVRVIHVVFAVVDVFEQPSLLDRFASVPRASREMIGVRLEILEVRALDAACGALEAHGDHFVAQAHDFEQLRTAVARNGGNAHLGHDLEQPLADSAAVAAAEFLAHGRFHFKRAFAQEIKQRLIRKVRIHCGGPVADQAGEMMCIARRARLHQDIALATQARLDQPVMNGTGGEQRMHGHFSLDEIPVGEQQHNLAAADRGLGLIAHLRQDGLEVRMLVVLQVDELVGYAGIRKRHDLPQFTLREHRR